MIQLTVAALVLFSLPNLPGRIDSCSLTVAQAPVFHKLRLGMKLEEVYKVIPGLKDDPSFQNMLRQAREDRLPRMASYALPSLSAQYADPVVARGVKGIHVGFYDESLVSYGFNYDWPIWDSADEFLGRLREAATLPDSNLWEGTRTGRWCRCAELQINVGISEPGGYINFADTTVQARMEAKRQVILKKAKQDFRP